MLGVMLGCTGITQLICPAIGYTSDRSTSRYGRRRPTMVAGALIACLGHGCMLACHHYRIGHLYLVSLTVAVFGMNCWCTVATASTRHPAPYTTAATRGCPPPPSPPPRVPSPRDGLVLAATPATRPCCRTSCCQSTWDRRAPSWHSCRHRVAASRTWTWTWGCSLEHVGQANAHMHAHAHAPVHVHVCTGERRDG